jgi:hypothetical protein
MRAITWLRFSQSLAPRLLSLHARLDFLLGGGGISLPLFMTGSVANLFIPVSKWIEISHGAAATKSHKGGRQPRRVGTQLR